MKIYVVLTLDTRRAKQNGSFPLVFRIWRGKSLIPIQTGYSLKEKDWDDTRKVIKNSYKGAKSIPWLNNHLVKQRAEYIDIIARLGESNELTRLSNPQLKDKLIGQSNQNDFFDYTEQLIEEMLAVKRIGNARIYKSVMTVLKTYQRNRKLKFEDINYDYLCKFEQNFFKKEGNSVNGLSTYMRTIRAIYNKAIKDGLVKEELYPFKLYTIKSEATQKKAISIENIQKIVALDLDESSPLFNERNYFLLSFYLMGTSYTDLAHLKQVNIIEDRIQYSRQKTNKKYDIRITPKAQSILSYYLEKYPKSEYILPIIKRKKPAEIYKDIEWARNRYTKKLKEIAILCDINQSLNSYTSRHSYATLAKNKGVPITAISEMLGHQSIKTTQVYLDSLKSDVIDKYHEDILED